MFEHDKHVDIIDAVGGIPIHRDGKPLCAVERERFLILAAAHSRGVPRRCYRIVFGSRCAFVDNIFQDTVRVELDIEVRYPKLWFEIDIWPKVSSILKPLAEVCGGLSRSPVCTSLSGRSNRSIRSVCALWSGRSGWTWGANIAFWPDRPSISLVALFALRPGMALIAWVTLGPFFPCRARPASWARHSCI